MQHLSSELLAELNAGIAKHHLEAVGDEIRKNAAECYALVAIGEDDYSSVGNTRLGGDPDLPEGVEWPMEANGDVRRYSNFIGQINFAEIPRLANYDVLPKSGLIYLFVRYMESAAEPVLLDGVFFDGDLSRLRRRRSPPNDSLCDEYLVDLVPQRIKAVPNISLATYQKSFRRHIEENTDEVNGESGKFRRISLECDLGPGGSIGQLLGFANASDERENLYRQVVLGQLGKRELVYNDYWDSMAEYEAYIEEWKDDERLVKMYRGMRDGVEWLTSNRGMISSLVDEWRLLFRLNSNSAMDLNINDGDPLYVFIRHEDLANRNFSNLAGEVTQG
jgi:uncharacterized protein YwqG